MTRNDIPEHLRNASDARCHRLGVPAGYYDCTVPTHCTGCGETTARYQGEPCRCEQPDRQEDV